MTYNTIIRHIFRNTDLSMLYIHSRVRDWINNTQKREMPAVAWMKWRDYSKRLKRGALGGDTLICKQLFWVASFVAWVRTVKSHTARVTSKAKRNVTWVETGVKVVAYGDGIWTFTAPHSLTVLTQKMIVALWRFFLQLTVVNCVTKHSPFFCKRNNSWDDCFLP